MNIVSKAKELLNQVLSEYSEEKNVYNSLTSFVIGNIEAESFTINIPSRTTILQNCIISSFKVNELVLKKTIGNPVTRINLDSLNNFVKKIILNLDCSSLILFSVSGLKRITTIENVNFPLINEYSNLFPNTVTDVSFIPDTISPKTVSCVIDLSLNENFSTATISSLSNAVQTLTEEEISENGGYGMIVFSSQVFSLITDELSEAFLSKGWEVIDNG